MVNETVAAEAAPESALIQRARRGDKSAFDELIQRHFGQVYAVAYSRLGNRDGAEDLAQEVFLRVYLHLDKFQEPGSFPAWLCRIARNLAEDWRRQSQSASRLLPMVSADQASIENVPDHKRELLSERIDRERRMRQVSLALETMPEGSREMVLLHYMEGMNPREIGAITGIHRTTVRYHLQRAINHLRRELEITPGDTRIVAGHRKTAAVRASAIVAATLALAQTSRASLTQAAAITGLTQPSAPQLLSTSIARLFSLLHDKIVSLGEEIMKTSHKVAGGVVGLLLVASVVMPAIAKMKHASEMQRNAAAEKHKAEAKSQASPEQKPAP